MQYDKILSLIKMQKQICHLVTRMINLQNVGKSETPFYIRVNNRRRDIKDPSAISACKHFNSLSHDFNTHGKFTIIDRLRNITPTSTKILNERLKKKTLGLKN